MSTLKSPVIICLPAHILDANISPRAREVLMLLASQTTAENPTVWVCHAAIAEKLRCSPVTVKRSIQKLVEAKLITETGDLHERRFKFYRVKWGLNSVTPAKAGVQKKNGKDWMPAPSQGAPSACMTMKKAKPAPKPKPTEEAPPSHPGVDLSAMLKDSRIAYWADIYGQQHEENLRRYQMEARILAQRNVPDGGDMVENFSYES